jgi:DNA recombination-mediator protein A
MSEHIAIVGSREYPDLEAVMAYVGALPRGTTVVSGGARGVDIHAEKTARAQGLAVVSYRPARVERGSWRITRTTTVGQASEHIWLPTFFPTFARAAYFRNGCIVDDCARLVAFWDGKSRGTLNSIELAEATGKPVEMHRP